MSDGGPGEEAPTWAALVRDAVASGVDRREALWMVQEASGEVALEERCTALTHHRFTTMVDRRLAGEPLQYVFGRWPFRSLDLMVDRRVLIPRPETEWVVEEACRLLHDGAGELQVLDLGTGSGAIALALVTELWPRARVVATDVSAAALEVARANLAGVGRPGTRVTLHEGSWWAAVPSELRGEVDLVVSNPPYVAPDDDLPPEVADWEPRSALVPDGAVTGLEAVEAVLAGAAEWLRPGGWVVVEIGETQGAAAAAAAEAAGLVDVEVRPDLTGRDRMVVARRPT